MNPTWRCGTWTPGENEPPRLGWPDIQIWTQPESQLRNLVEQHISGKRLAWYFFAAALMALAFETLLLRRWNKLFS